MLNRKRNKNLEDIDDEIQKWKMQNKEKVEISVFPGEVEYLIKGGYIINPTLFQIKNNNFLNMPNCPNFLKTKHSKKNKRIYRLKKRERELLKNLNIEYETFGIILYL